LGCCRCLHQRIPLLLLLLLLLCCWRHLGCYHQLHPHQLLLLLLLLGRGAPGQAQPALPVMQS
jgi:hypothetical protein